MTSRIAPLFLAFLALLVSSAAASAQEEHEEEEAVEFATTRVYVHPPGSFEFEYWMIPTLPRSGPAEIQSQYEFEIGLPGRFQVGLYMISNQEGNDGPMSFDEQKFEVRWAFADWGRIPANPTLYFELDTRDQEPDVIETKLLFGDELADDWHWGANLVFAHETGGDFENEHEITAAACRTFDNDRFSLGAEMKAGLVNTHDDRGDFEESLLIGPSFGYRPRPNIHLDFVTLA